MRLKYQMRENRNGFLKGKVRRPWGSWNKEIAGRKRLSKHKKATKASKAIFEEYIREKKLHHPENREELASVLKSFYAEVRKKDGSEYTKNLLCSIRFGLNRHYSELFSATILSSHKEFDEANSVYEAQCVALKKRGLAKTEHKPPIADEDIKRLYESGVFNTDSPTTLQNKVFFEIMFFFCRRGRQNLRELKWDDFDIKKNPQVLRCVVKKNGRTHEKPPSKRCSSRRRGNDGRQR